MNPIETVAEYLIKNAELLGAEIVEYAVAKLDFEVPKEELRQAIIIHADFIHFLGDTLTNKDDKKVKEGLIEWSKKYAVQQASSMGNISSFIRPYADNRLFLINRITKITIGNGLSTEEVVAVNNRIHYMLDTSIAETVLAYEQFKDKTIKEAQREANELSAPIVPIQDGMAILPLIGSIDTNRANYLLEKVVPRIAELKVECLIIDFSGIVMIDTGVANHIFKINDVLRLLGINVMATGIRPELAQTVVQGGLDFSSIRTYANVKQAIESTK